MSTNINKEKAPVMTTVMSKEINDYKGRLKILIDGIDERGRRTISNSLKDTIEDPERQSDVISKIQSAFAMKYQRANPALIFLDLLKCPRNIVYQNLFETMKSKLDAQLTRLDENNLLIMLKESIQFLAIKELKSIPINIIKSLKIVPDKYLKYLAMKNFLSDLPMQVRRQAWEINNALFITAINENCEASLLVKEVSERSQDGPIRLICDCIGVSDVLFHAFANHCVQKSYENNNPLWGALIRQVLMGVQEGGKKIISLGKLSELGWLLDSFRRVGKIEDNKFINIFDTLKNLIIAQSTNEEKLYEKSMQEYHKLKGEIYQKEKQNNKLNSKVINLTSEQAFSTAISTAFTKSNKPSSSKKKAVSKPKQLQKRKHHYEDGELEDDDEYGDDGDDEYKDKDEPKTSRNTRKIENKRTFQDLSEEEADYDEVPKLKKVKKNNPKQETNFEDTDDDEEDYLEDGSDTEFVSKRTLRKRNSSSSIKYYDEDAEENEEEDAELEFVRKQQLQKERKQNQRIKDEQIKVNKTKEINQQYSFKKDDKLTHLLEEGLEYIKQLDIEKIFTTRVTDDMAPNYSKEIKNPMDLSSIKRKLDFGKYIDINSFDHDVRLVYNNCIQYNGIESYYGNVANGYLDKWNNKKKFIDLKLSNSDDTTIEAFKEVEEEEYDKEEITMDPEFISALESNIASIDVSNKMKEYDYFIFNSEVELKKSIQYAVEYCWNFLSYLDIDGIFATPVTDMIAPGYSSYIVTPMDLSTMRVKKDRKKYKNLKSFDTDVKLMLSNCIQWNTDVTSIYRQVVFIIIFITIVNINLI
jgi:bromodomain-containing factor 1